MGFITFALLFLVGIAAILIAKLNSNGMKIAQGAKGERVVAKQLKLWFGSKQNYIFNDVTLPTARGTTQIDHLVISRVGIICIETKKLNGTIYGDPDSQNWTHFNGRGDKNSMYNPLKQNIGHINHLAKILDVDAQSIIGVVVNVGNAKLKGAINPFFGKPLIERGTGFIFWLWFNKRKVLTQDQVNVLGMVIKSKALEQSAETNKAHIASVKKYSKKKSWF